MNHPSAISLEALPEPHDAGQESPVSSSPTPKRGGLGWVGALGAGAALALAIYAGIHSRNRAEAQLIVATQAAAIPTVNVISPKAGSAAEEIALPGNTQAFTDTPIYAHTAGYLKRWHADIGARVHAGDLLAEIEAPELDQQLRQAEADLLSAEANLQLAKLTNARWQTLLAQRVVSAQEADQVKSDLGVKQALDKAGEANVRRLRELQNYERVVAPFDGVITARNTDIGALVDSATAGSARELFHLAAVDRLRIYVAVPEIYAPGIKDGDKVAIAQNADAKPGFVGTVVRNSSAIDQTTRTLNVEVDVENQDGRLLPGSYVFVRMKLAAGTGSVTVPSNALLFRSEGLRAARVREGRVELVPVTIGHDFGATLEVTSGLTPQDSIVIDPPESILDGAEVKVSAAKTPGA